MQDTTNRTFICSVAFVDLVGYSKKLVSEQVQCKDRFNLAISEAIKDTPVADRIVLDTGDGAAISFLGDPEDALFVTLALRDAYAKLRTDFPEDAIRMGINLGPVKLVKDINGQPNIIGDGINVAQRIMSFARPSQILVSRSYHEAVSRISEEYAKLFLYEGSKTDKHVREHEVFLVGDSEGAIAKIREGVAGRVASASQLGDTQVLPRPSANRGIKIAAGSAIALIIALSVALALKKPATDPVPVVKDDPPKVAVAPSAPVPAVEIRPPDVSVSGDAKPGEPTKPDPTKPEPSANKPETKGDGKTVNDTKGIDTKTAAPKAADPKTVDTAKAAEKRPPGKFDPKTQGQLIVSIRPWGNVIINGKQAGIAPPNNQYALRPGKYEVRFTNSESFAPRVETIEIKVGETLRLSHEFK